eukprot:6194846-Pleurochrysis_carterae.AAC.3
MLQNVAQIRLRAPHVNLAPGITSISGNATNRYGRRWQGKVSPYSGVYTPGRSQDEVSFAAKRLMEERATLLVLLIDIAITLLTRSSPLAKAARGTLRKNWRMRSCSYIAERLVCDASPTQSAQQRKLKARSNSDAQYRGAGAGGGYDGLGSPMRSGRQGALADRSSAVRKRGNASKTIFGKDYKRSHSAVADAKSKGGGTHLVRAEMFGAFLLDNNFCCRPQCKRCP